VVFAIHSVTAWPSVVICAATLVLEGLQAPHLADLHPAVLGAPAADRRVGHAVAAPGRAEGGPGFDPPRGGTNSQPSNRLRFRGGVTTRASYRRVGTPLREAGVGGVPLGSGRGHPPPDWRTWELLGIACGTRGGGEGRGEAR
jgi:hypothetical protein